MQDSFDPQKIEQDLARFRDTIPRLWWALYTGALDSGFTAEQALELVKSWIQGTSNKG